MRKMLFSFLVVALLSFVAVAQDTGQGTAKGKKAIAPATPKSDAEIQTCINDKFKTSTSIKNGNASVSSGVASLAGEASSGGAKGGATRSARACGAKSVVNNITVPPKPKAAKPADATPKKP
jgi:osmotically-inducible protein OsmY